MSPLATCTHCMMLSLSGYLLYHIVHASPPKIFDNKHLGLALMNMLFEAIAIKFSIGCSNLTLSSPKFINKNGQRKSINP